MLPAPLPEEIVSVCCAQYGLSFTQFASRERSPRIAAARELCVWLCRTRSEMSFPEIARAMGRPNHSSTLTMYQRMEPVAESRAAEIAQAEAALDQMISDRVKRVGSYVATVINDPDIDRMRERRLSTAEKALARLCEIHRSEEDEIRRRIMEERAVVRKVQVMQ